MGRVRRGRKVNGVLVLNKPAGMTSNDAVQQAKRIFAAQGGSHRQLRSIGYWCVAVVFGEATKFSQYLLDADKKYRAHIKLGVTTDTGDADGEVLERKDVAGITADDVRQALGAFGGKNQQLPPMYSALKHNGQPLYKLARQGIEVERKIREVTVFSNELNEFNGDECTLELHCSKGTYVRSIAEGFG